MFEKGNFYSVKLDGEMIVGVQQKTTDGRHVFYEGESGRFSTPIGEIEVTIPEYFHRAVVIVSGENLARPVRVNSQMDALRHKEAVSGRHRIVTGGRFHGAATFGRGRVVEVISTI